MQWINNFLVSKKNEAKTQIKRSKIKLLYLLAPSLFRLNRAKCSACADKFPTCLHFGYPEMFSPLTSLVLLKANLAFHSCFTYLMIGRMKETKEKQLTLSS
jgi:hypothetical protein